MAVSGFVDAGGGGSMRINVDPMPALRLSAAEQVNGHYLPRLGSALVIHSVHERKAAQADGANASDAFKAEAKLRGMSVKEFSDLVRDKARAENMLDAIELSRQQKPLTLDAAQTPAEIAAILASITD
jgi:hypothetical protein